MTDPTPTDDPPGAARSGRSRQVLALWLGGGLVVFIVVAVLVVTLVSGDTEDRTNRTGDAPTQSAGALPRFILDGLSDTTPVPQADYRRLCEVMGKMEPVDTSTPAGLGRALEGIDVDALAGSAPPELASTVQLMRDSIDDVAGVLRSVDSYAELEPADFPQGFLPAFALLYRIATEECGAPG